jgi:hypothetical protein
MIGEFWREVLWICGWFLVFGVFAVALSGDFWPLWGLLW